MSRTPSYEYEVLHQFEAIFRDGENKTQVVRVQPGGCRGRREMDSGAREKKGHGVSRAGKRPNPIGPHYATAIAIVYDTICCPHCQCPEHRSGKIRSEIRFDSMPPTETFRGWAKHVTSFPLDRERGNGPMNAKAVRARAAVLAELIGVPLEDETR